jgi:hypothetical protein
MQTSNRLSWVIAIIGVWEIVASFILGYSVLSRVAMWNEIIFGVALIIFGAWSAISDSVGTDRTLDWINAIIGVWLIVAPFVLGYSALTTALWNDIIVGAVVLVLGVWAALSVHTPVTERPIDREV